MARTSASLKMSFRVVAALAADPQQSMDVLAAGLDISTAPTEDPKARPVNGEGQVYQSASIFKECGVVVVGGGVRSTTELLHYFFPI